MALEKDSKETTHGLASLEDNIHTILYGSNTEKEKIRGRFFHIADTPDFMKKLGLSGDFFSIRYGVISRHLGKDLDHNLTEQNWLDFKKEIIDPIIITKFDKGYRLYVLINSSVIPIAIGINKKTVRQGLEVNSICTVFKYNPRNQENEEIIYRIKNNL